MINKNAQLKIEKKENVVSRERIAVHTQNNYKLKARVLKKDLRDILFWMAVSAIMLKPESIAYFGWAMFDNILDYFKIAISFVCILVYFIKKKKNKVVVLAVVDKIVAAIVTIINGGDIKEALIFLITAFVFMLMIYWGCDNKNIISALYYVLTIFCIINIITIMLFPKGMYSTQEIGWEKNWFLGYKTILPLYTIPESALAFLFYYNTGKIRHLFIFLIAIIQPFMEGGAGAMISSIVLMLGFWISLSDMTKMKRLMNVRFIFIGHIIVSYLLIIGNLTEKLGREFFALFKKNSTLTTRTTILWPINVKAFLQRPILGYGYLKQDDFLKVLGAHRAHNMSLAIMISSGIVGFLVFIYFIRHLHISTQKYIGTRAYGFCASCICALFISGLTEAYDNLGIAGIIYIIPYFLPLLFEKSYETIRV